MTFSFDQPFTENWILIFASYTGSKNQVQNRLKIQFVELNFSKLIFQKSSTTGVEHGLHSLKMRTCVILFSGAETTSSSLLWAILFLLHHPEVQRKVQAEIDEVVGPSRRVSLGGHSKTTLANF